MDWEEHERRQRKRLGMAMTAIGLLGFVALWIARDSNRLFSEHTVVFCDFTNVTGLRAGSPVQIAGVLVGNVERVEFAHVKYECDPLTEDVGRWGQGRTDSCDVNLFCAPTSMCADLEPYAGHDKHTACDASDDCAEDEICVTGAFRNRAGHHVEWTGQLGLCARFYTEHWRTRVKMKIPSDELALVREDSRANVAANSVLGDQVVNISPGQGDPIGGDFRIQARSSLSDDIEKLRQRIDRALENADDAMIAILDVIDVFKDEKTLSDLKGMLDNFDVITRHIAFGEGLVGALLSSQEYRNDLGTTISSLRRTASGLETATDHGNLILDKVDRNIEPVLDETRATLQEVDALLVELDDPSNKSLVAKVLRDDKGDIARDLELIFDHGADISDSTVKITRAVERGDGTLGKLINDDRLRRDIGRLLHNLARHEVIKGILLWYLSTKGINVSNARDSARPPRQPR